MQTELTKMEGKNVTNYYCSHNTDFCLKRFCYHNTQVKTE